MGKLFDFCCEVTPFLVCIYTTAVMNFIYISKMAIIIWKYWNLKYGAEMNCEGDDGTAGIDVDDGIEHDILIGLYVF